MKIAENANFSYPDYMDVIYEGLYDNDKICKKMDRSWRCNLRSLGSYNKLVAETYAELSEGQRVCQFGVVFGNQIEKTAKIIGITGEYDIIDVNKNVIKRTKDKYAGQFKQLKLIQNDAAKIKPSAIYDAVICFLLLSMVPQKHKKELINNALKMIKPEGKAIFVDWHNPSKWNPLRWPIRSWQRLYNPFMDQLWDEEITDFNIIDKAKFSWKTTYYFGGLFQKTVAIRMPEEEELTDFMQLYL